MIKGSYPELGTDEDEVLSDFFGTFRPPKSIKYQNKKNKKTHHEHWEDD